MNSFFSLLNWEFTILAAQMVTSPLQYMMSEKESSDAGMPRAYAQSDGALPEERWA